LLGLPFSIVSIASLPFPSRRPTAAHQVNFTTLHSALPFSFSHRV
jgi:hypothetical protein